MTSHDHEPSGAIPNRLQLMLIFPAHSRGRWLRKTPEPLVAPETNQGNLYCSHLFPCFDLWFVVKTWLNFTSQQLLPTWLLTLHSIGEIRPPAEQDDLWMAPGCWAKPADDGTHAQYLPIPCLMLSKPWLTMVNKSLMISKWWTLVHSTRTWWMIVNSARVDMYLDDWEMVKAIVVLQHEQQ